MTNPIFWTTLWATVAAIVAAVAASKAAIAESHSAKWAKEANVLSKWATLYAECQRLGSVEEKDVDKINEISERINQLRAQHPNVVPDWDPCPETFKSFLEKYDRKHDRKGGIGRVKQPQAKAPIGQDADGNDQP